MPNRSSDFFQRFNPQRQRGAAMMFAIAIIIVASLLGAAMVRMLRVEQVGVARDVLSTRALLAADSAAQKVMYDLFQTGTACVSPGTSISFAGVSGLNNCSATSSCTSYTATGSSKKYYSIRTTGTCGPAADPATRQIEVLARDI